MDFGRLEKLVRLAGSDNDHEALLALRNAQKLAKGDLWGALKGAGSHHHHESSSERRRIQALEKQLEERRAKIASLTEEISELRNKLRTARSGDRQELQLYFEHEGFPEIYYEVQLKRWIEDNRFRPSTSKENWISVGELKRMFDKTLDRSIEVSLKRFSVAFSRCLSPKGGKSLAVKGGPKQDLMGFMVKSQQ